MAASPVKTVTQCIASLPLERRKELAKHSDNYRGQPLDYAALAARKNCISLHLMGAYMLPEQAMAIKTGSAAISPSRFIVRYEELIRRPRR